MKRYLPAPIDTTDVALPPQLTALTEKLARQIHDTWAAGRLKEGWTYGPVRDDRLKTTPCLVDYDELPESEREYDRNTALEAVRMIIKLGYTIQPKE